MTLIDRIVSETTRYNLHSHTEFCDGRYTMRQMAESACAAGMLHYAFTPHSPVPLSSPCNMRLEDVPLFLEQCDSLRHQFEDSVTLYSGMEIDYISPGFGPHTAMFADIPLQIRIGSVHFVPDRKGTPVDCDGSPERFAANLAGHFAADLRYVVEKYFNQVLEMLERGGFDIVGHCDKIAANASSIDSGIEQNGWYIDLMDTVIKSIAAHGYAVEINTKAYTTKGRFFPHPDYWKRLRDNAVTLVVNSDAHYTGKINAGRSEAFEILSNI